MLINPFKQAIREGRPQIGLWSSLCSNVSAEVISGAGFDWILVDTEHAPNELPLVFSQLQGLVGGTAAPVVRPAWNDVVLIKRFLDIGAQNLLIPDHPDVGAAIEDVGQRIRKAGKAAGILAPIEADARHWLKQGYTVVAVGSDLSVLARGTEALAAKFKP